MNKPMSSQAGSELRSGGMSIGRNRVAIIRPSRILAIAGEPKINAKPAPTISKAVNSAEINKDEVSCMCCPIQLFFLQSPQAALISWGNGKIFLSQPRKTQMVSRSYNLLISKR